MSTRLIEGDDRRGSPGALSDLSPCWLSYPARSPLQGVWALERRLEPLPFAPRQQAALTSAPARSPAWQSLLCVTPSHTETRAPYCLSDWTNLRYGTFVGLNSSQLKWNTNKSFRIIMANITESLNSQISTLSIALFFICYTEIIKVKHLNYVNPVFDTSIQTSSLKWIF